ncbi:hypothetical protein ACE01N_04050 [Saccharicrinis sp. FJH2]|uniref:hypothetical protein n=1 Tax=Saccharicrinis sp. FJH65 TaxID=3344659 RepID=UPI0035F2DF25
MKYSALLVILFFSVAVAAKKPDADKILKEGKMLYTLQEASVVATTHFLQQFPAKAEKANGYLSYINGNEINTIIYYHFDSTQILARYHFAASQPDKIAGIPETRQLVPTELEDDLITMREKAIEKIKVNKDGYFTYYDGVSFTLLPVINNHERCVYVMSGSKVGDVIILGNDYQLRFDKNNKYRGVERIHKSLVKLSTKAGMDTTQNATLHKHFISEAIDPTDICTLLLYKDQVEWDLHYVLSRKYVSVFDLKNEKLAIIKTKDWKKIGSGMMNE